MSVRKVLDEVTSDSDYNIRWFQPQDRVAFLDLYKLAFNERGEEWFSWKYEQNPYTDRVPIIVADKDGELAGIRPFNPLPLRVGDRTLLTHQLVDLVVHPDHRRKGLMTRMSRWMNAAIWDESAATFTYANPPARHGLMKMKSNYWTNHELGSFVRYERINDVSAFVDADLPLSVRFGVIAVNPVYQIKHRLQDQFSNDDSAITITRHESVPVSVLIDLYETAPPNEAHVPRDETFYQWRFEEPNHDFVTYVAEREGVPVAAIVVGIDENQSTPSTAQLVEVLPLANGHEFAAAFSALLSEITADFSMIDHICAANESIPQAVFTSHGFTRTDAFPLSKFVERTSFIVCPLGGLEDDPETATRLVRDDGWIMSHCVRLLG